MKLQNLAIIFLVIAIPLIIILSYYLTLQQKTLKLQAEYDTKLEDSTKEGIKAFEVNTVDWSEWASEVSSKKTRENVQAAINTFITSLSNNLNISGTAKEYMLNYIPAVAVTMYDGYYIYAPTSVPVTLEDDDGVQLFYETSSGEAHTITTKSEEGEILYIAETGGETYYYEYINSANEVEPKTYTGLTTDVSKAKTEYQHILNNKIDYAERYKETNTDVMVNYTLDNRIYVYGTVNGESIDKDGYLIYIQDSQLPRANLTSASSNPKISDIDVVNNGGIADVQANDTRIETETLEEQVLYYENGIYNLNTFTYIYDTTHEKLYYDTFEENFFTINASSKERNFISNDSSIKIGSPECKYKSVSILWGNDDKTTEYKKVYQALNGSDKGKWCISIKPENAKELNNGKEVIDTEIKENSEQAKRLAVYNIPIYKDCSAISYYVEAYAFTNWVKANLQGLHYTVKNEDGTYSYKTTNELFNITENNNPEEETSPIVQHKKEVMKNTIITNLNLAISNYNGGTAQYGYKLPVLTDTDWEQIFTNISLISFFQGVPIGLKYYNNYAIATSTTNREYVDPGEIYLSGEDDYYHRVYCEKCGNVVYTGYRSVEYVQKEFLIDADTSDTTYYYLHDKSSDTNSEKACYYCAVNRATYTKTKNSDIAYLQAKSYNEALARERYYQKEDIEGKIGITITYHANKTVKGEITGIYNVPQPETVDIGVSTTLSTQKPYITSSNKFIKFIFKGWSKDPLATTPEYLSGDTCIFMEDVDLYAVWQLSLTSMEWNMDYYYKNQNIIWGPTSSGIVNDGSISNVRIIENTTTVEQQEINTIIEMIGNGTDAGKGAIWTHFTSEFLELNSFQFNYYVNKGDSFNAAGFMFDIKDCGSYLEGYLLSINFEGVFYQQAKQNGAIYKFKYYKGFNGTSFSRNDLKLVISLPFSNYNSSRYSDGNGWITIERNNAGGYTIKGGELEQNYTVPAYHNDSEAFNTFGFFSDHYDHNCAQQGYFKIDKMVVTAIEKY